MPHWLPWALLLLLVLLVAAMPWKHTSPYHQFMLEQWNRLRDDGGILTREHTVAAGHHHGSGSAHV